MVCEIPKLTVTGWFNKDIKIAGPTYRKFYEKIKASIRALDVATIIGQPGMGKTTLLKKIESEFEKSHLPIYLDLANKDNIAEEFWVRIELFSNIRNKAFTLINPKEVGYGIWKRILRVKFEDHVKSVCNKYDNAYLRIYCLNYGRDYDGMIKALNDIKAIGNVILLIDEVRESHINAIHRLINANLGIPIVIAMPTHAFSKISDLAIRRRIEESKISLDGALTEEDIKEIIEAYCKELSEELLISILPLWRRKEISTVSYLLQFMKNEIEKISKECQDVTCMKEKLRGTWTLKNVDDDTKELEKRIRETLGNLAKEYGITYIHPRGKKVETNGKSVIANLFFLIGDSAYLGVIRLSNDNEIRDPQELSIIGKVIEVEHEKKTYSVKGRILITNIPNLSIEGFIKLELGIMEIMKIKEGDYEILEEKIREMFKELNNNFTILNTIQSYT